MVTADSYYSRQEVTATTAKARRAQNYAKRMLDIIAEFGLLAKNSLLPAYIGLFAYVDELMKRSKNDATADLSHASAVEATALKTTPQMVMPAPKSPLMAQSAPSRIQFRNGNPLQVNGLKDTVLVIPANLTSGPSKPEVKAERQKLGNQRIQFRPNDMMALKPKTDLFRSKELDLAEQAVRDDRGNLVFLTAEEKRKREREDRITFWKPDEPTANINATPQSLFASVLKRRR